MQISAGPHYLDDTLTFSVITTRFDTGALTDADAVPAFRVYEDETGTAILTGDMAKLDDAGTTGFYSEQLTLSAANGFEAGKSYQIYVTAAVNSVTGGVSGGFRVSGVHPANVTQFGGSNGTFSGGRPEVNTSHAAGTAWNSGAIGASTLASDTITAAKIAADAITAAKIADGAIDAATFTAGAINNAAMSIDGSELTAIPWNAAWDAEVQSEVEDGLIAHNLDHLVKSAVDTNFATTVHADSVIGQIADNGAGFDRTTDSLEAIRDNIGTPAGASVSADVAAVKSETAAIVADTNELQTDWADGGRLDLILDARASQASVDTVDDLLDTEIAAILEDTGTTLDDFIDTEIAAIKAQTDKLTFNASNQLLIDLRRINNTVVNGDGAGTPWGP